MTHMTRRRFNTVVMGLALLSTGVFAGSARAAEPDAAAQVAALNAGLVAVGKAGKTPFDQRFAGLAPVIDRVFNVSQFLQSSVGLRWANLATAEQATLLRVFWLIQFRLMLVISAMIPARFSSWKPAAARLAMIALLPVIWSPPMAISPALLT